MAASEPPKRSASVSWTGEDDARLKQLVLDGASPARAAVILSISMQSVQQRARRLGFAFPIAVSSGDRWRASGPPWTRLAIRGFEMNHKFRPWTEPELTTLRNLSEEGKDVLHIAVALDRTLGSVIAQMFKLGIPIPRSKIF